MYDSFRTAPPYRTDKSIKKYYPTYYKQNPCQLFAYSRILTDFFEKSMIKSAPADSEVRF